MKFQVEVDLSSHGYVEVEASDATAAGRAVRHLQVSIDWMGDVDAWAFDAYADITVGHVCEVEEADASSVEEARD
jgi:hypothetical protein